MTIIMECKIRIWYICVGMMWSVYGIWLNRDKWYYWLYKVNGDINEVNMSEVVDVFIKMVLFLGVLVNSTLVGVQLYAMFSSGMTVSYNKMVCRRFGYILSSSYLIYWVLTTFISSLLGLVAKIKSVGITKIAVLNGLSSNIALLESILVNLLLLVTIIWLVRKVDLSVGTLVRNRRWIAMMGLVLATLCSSSEVVSQLVVWLVWQTVIECEIMSKLNRWEVK